MIATIQDHPDVVASFVGVLMLILGYFIRKVARKIDTHSEMITTIKGDLTLQLVTMRSNIKDDIVEAFNDICTERQGSCSRLQQAKLDTLTATHTAICAKLARLDEERRETWGVQRRWNDKIETTIYKDGGHK
jgi:hypothetical protein